MSLKPLMQRGPASPPLPPVIADHYLTSYNRDFQSPRADGKVKVSPGAAGFPTPRTTEALCVPGSGQPGKPETEYQSMSRLHASAVREAVGPSCRGGYVCESRLTNTEENPRLHETTYGDEFCKVNSVENPVADHHQCSVPASTAAPASAGGLHFYPHETCRTHPIQKKITVCNASGAESSFAAVNTFKTTYGEKFNDSSSVRALVPPSSCTDTQLITAPKYGPPCWGVNEKPPPYVPGAEFTYPAEKPIIRYVNQSTTHASYQHRTRKHEVISYDAGGDAVSRASPTAAQSAHSAVTPAAARDSNKPLHDKVASEAPFQLSGTNPSATAPRQYRLYEVLQAPDRRHEFFALAGGVDEEKRRAEAEAAAKIPPRPSSAKPTLHDMFEDYKNSQPPRDTCGVRGELCGVGSDPCPMYGEVPYGGLDAFHESVDKFAPIKSSTTTKTPYCKPWQPLTKVVHADADPKSFDFSPAPVAAQDGFIPVCPTVTHDGQVGGRKRKDWKPEGCTVQA